MDKPATKRGVLSITSSVYDPLGFVSPFILKAKLIFQELCRRKLSWDDNQPEDLAMPCQMWLGDLPQLSLLRVPRCLKLAANFQSDTQLYCFSNASDLAYGAVAYLRVDHQCKFIMSKSKLAPIKAVSIPRLELSAATVATDLNQIIKQHLRKPSFGQTA